MSERQTEQKMINEVAENGGEYSYKKEAGEITDVHRTIDGSTQQYTDKMKAGKKVIIAGFECEIKPVSDNEFQILTKKEVCGKELVAVDIYPSEKSLPEAKRDFESTLRNFKKMIEDCKKKSTKLILVLHITTSFGKRYTCRSVSQLEVYIDNVKKEKKLKRDEDVDIQLGFGRMTQAAYDSMPACKYFIKT